jgi:hypothetical protein
MATSTELVLWPYVSNSPRMSDDYAHQAAMENFHIIDWALDPWLNASMTRDPGCRANAVRGLEAARNWRDMYLRWARQSREIEEMS